MLSSYSISVMSPVMFFEDVIVVVMSSHGKLTDINMYETKVTQMTAIIF